MRLLSALADGDVSEYSPSVADETDELLYPEAERLLDESNRAASELLEELTDRGILHREFQEKEYVCPDCPRTTLQFTTGCGACSSIYIIQDEVEVHRECGHADAESAFRADGDEWSCPGCEAIVDPAEDLERRRLYVCQDCGEATESPEHWLRCRNCRSVYMPMEADERVFCRYTFADGGEAWFETQREARELLATSLSERGYDVTVDETVGSGDPTYLADVFGEDALLGERVVGDVHEHPDAESVNELVTAAQAADARPMLVTTSGTLDAKVAEIVEAQDLHVLSPAGGDLAPSYEVTEDGETSTVFQRLTSSVTGRFQ